MNYPSRPLAIMALLALVSLGVAGQQPAAGIDALAQYNTAAQGTTVAFPVVERAVRAVRATDGDAATVAFMLRHVQRFPDDVANGYLLTVVGDVYRDQGARELAHQYYRRALLSYPDVIVRGVAAHRVAANRLLLTTDDPSERIEYLLYVREQFPDESDMGLIAWYLGHDYEAIGEWATAFEHYRIFLASPGTVVPGHPGAYETVRQRVAFFDSSRNWTERDLDTLVTSIKNALWTQNSGRLLRYRAEQNFFTMSWEQEAGDANSEIPSFDIAAFLERSRVRFSDELDLSSNAREAYLRTWGWSHRIPTWYFYFRRVDFPADPEIHGSWEWAGIFFGESL